MKNTDLKFQQEAAARVEQRMLAFLAKFTPAEELTLASAKTIAFEARRFAFDEFAKTDEARP